MRKHEEDDLWDILLRKVIRLVDLVIARLESLTKTALSITIEGEPMANFPLDAGDSVVLTVTDTDDVTGDVVTPDAGSVSAVLSSATDTIVVNADGSFTLTAGAAASTGNTVTVEATVGGVPSTPGVGTYDVVGVTPPPPDSTTLSVSFGTETAPVAPAAAEAPASEEPGTFRNS